MAIMAFSQIYSGEVLTVGFFLPYTSVQDPNQTFPALKPIQARTLMAQTTDLRETGQKGSEQGVVW